LTLIDLAGWRVRLTCRPDVLAAAVAVRYAAFAAPAGPVALEAQVTLDGALRAAPGPEITVRASVDGCLGSKYLFDTPGFSGIINFASGKAGLALSSAAALEDVEYFLRIVYALVADCEGGLLIHAAGLVVDGGVHLFTGQSGSGKSTVVTLSPHAIALGDDLILLRPGADGWTAHGTPFWNAETLQRADQTASGPLVGIYKLIQDRTVYVEPLSPAAAAAELVANCPVVNGLPDRLPGLLARCRALAQAVPVARLHFRKDPDFWGVLGCPSKSSGK